MVQKKLYRITFSHLDKIYEIYARNFYESEMFGFLEVEDFVFGEQSTLVVDPSEERLKQEFSNIKRTFIPIHSVYRIDEVDKLGDVKILDQNSDRNKVSVLPLRNTTKPQTDRN